MSTLDLPYPEGVTHLDKDALPRGAFVRRLLTQAPTYDSVILNGAVGVDALYDERVLAGFIARRHTKVLLSGCYWEPGSRRLTRRVGTKRIAATDSVTFRGASLVTAIVRGLDHPNLHYGVLSHFEAENFPKLWGVAPERVHFVPYFAKMLPGPSALTRATAAGRRTVFAGGNSLRDYRALIEASGTINADVVIATQLELPSPTSANLKIAGVTPTEYERLAADAAIQVVPLVANSVRSAGHQTYLNAMALGVPVVVTDAPGVRDHIEDGVTGVIVPPNDPATLAAAINSLLSDPARTARIGTAAQDAVAHRYTRECYAHRLWTLACRIAAGE